MRIRGRRALIPYVTAGFPDDGTCFSILREMAQAGADLIEIGIPFSDPIADGAVIQQTSQWALERGVRLKDVFALAGRLSEHTRIPIVLMGYYNSLLQYGLDKFVHRASLDGVRGLIVPDLPPEEAEDLRAVGEKHSVGLVHLCAPTSSPERIRLLGEKTSGFLYLVSVTGVTGIRERLPQELPEFIRRVRKNTSSPICVGFGISSPKQAQEAASAADGVIIGSAFLRFILEHSREKDLPQRVGTFLGGFRQALDEIRVLQ
ncbi:MAG: tryptophan synthase subunit alpha [Armatimonadetes bacterium]|nr:tryptophan synthase subunit alpha [Armatimonadota bacterium]